MCDILVAMPDATASGRVVFGKNSDRPAGECQVWYDSRGEDRPAGGRVPCAFVEVEDTSAPLRTIGCRPYWCRGYETGANEAGVVGGNTAVYTRALHLPENRKTLGLTGMELLRFGLERGRTAEAAVAAIVDLLARYGQWAPAVRGKDAPEGCYENAYLLADSREAWILETSGRRWAARRFTGGVHNLSNQLTIRTEWTRASDDLADYAAAQGWWDPSDGPFDFALACSDHEHYPRQVSHVRWSRAHELLRANVGGIDAATMMRILRDHYEDTFLGGPFFNAFLPDLLTLCMHDSPAGFTWGNTATSVIVEIDPDAPGSSPMWSCYQPPCTSVYIAGTLDAAMPGEFGRAGTAGLRNESPATVPPDTFLADSLWWRLYRVLGGVARSPASRRAALRARFDPIEARALERVRSLGGKPAAEHAAAMSRVAREQLDELARVLDDLEREWGLKGD